MRQDLCTGGLLVEIFFPASVLVHLLASTKNDFPVFRLSIGSTLLLLIRTWNTEASGLGEKSNFTLYLDFLGEQKTQWASVPQSQRFF